MPNNSAIIGRFAEKKYRFIGYHHHRRRLSRLDEIIHVDGCSSRRSNAWKWMGSAECGQDADLKETYSANSDC